MDNGEGRGVPPLRAVLLGPARISWGEDAIPESAWPPRAGRSLLLLLLSTPDHSLPRDRVLDLLWSEASPEAALNAYSKALHALRRVLEPGLQRGRASAYVEAGPELVALRAEAAVWIDADAFERDLRRAASRSVGKVSGRSGR